ncbi:MAG: GNAT family N-acetyltransferase [Chloroflexi bacterium]|nr:GNAT family N-acetyltransferase [Chloroflexota bacterium]
MHIHEVDPNIKEAGKLIAELDSYQQALYPAESNHLEDINNLASPTVTFVIAYLKDQAVGCGAIKDINRAYGEIKRMYVSPQARGFGLGKTILSYLEKKALAKQIRIARLETGVHQKAALGLYKQMGYKRIAPFGDYELDPLSVFMEKRLS